jgi:hypothetical protein
MDHAGEVCVGGLGVAVADDGVAIGEWVGIGIGHRGLNVSPPGSPGPMSALARIADSSWTSREVRKVPILLQKSFWDGERKFLEPLKRFTRGDVRDHILHPKSITDLRSGVEKRRSSREVQRSTFARFLGLFDFRLLQQNRRKAAIPPLRVRYEIEMISSF